jgi:surface protein
MLLIIGQSVIAISPDNPEDHLVLKFIISQGVSTIEFKHNPDPDLAYNYSVDWDNDMNFELVDSPEKRKHEYNGPGIIIVRIKGEFSPYQIPSSCFEVLQWGKIKYRSFERAFENCSNLRIVAPDAPDLSELTNMDKAFLGCNLANSNMNHWDVSNVERMLETFKLVKCNIDISDWDVSKVTMMNYMFENYYSFNCDISRWNTKSLKYASSMFQKASNFNQDISNWDVSKVKDFSYMFRDAKLFNQDINNWDVSSGENFTGMFQGASSFNEPLDKWGDQLRNVFFFQSMFERAVSFNQDISNWNFSSAKNMRGMFYKAESFNQDISGWNLNISGCDYTSMFEGALSFNQDLSNWAKYIKNAKSIKRMFLGAVSFNQDISTWDFSNKEINEIVLGANLSKENYKKLIDKISKSDLSSISDTELIFSNESDVEIDKLKTKIQEEKNVIVHDLGSSDTDCFIFVVDITNNKNVKLNLSDTKLAEYDFQVKFGEKEWRSITQPEVSEVSEKFEAGKYKIIKIKGKIPSLSYVKSNAKLHSILNWGDIQWESFNSSFLMCSELMVLSKEGPELAKCHDIGKMFYGCTDLTGYFKKWNTSNVEKMNHVFGGCTNFEEDLSDWNTSKVKTFELMFFNTNLSCDIGNWNVESAENMAGMFQSVQCFNRNLNGWNTLSAKNFKDMFKNAYSFNQSVDHFDMTKAENLFTMFSCAYSFNQSISSWKCPNVTNVFGMFSYAYSFNKEIISLVFPNVEDCSSFLNSASSFNQEINPNSFPKSSNFENFLYCAFSFNKSLEGLCLVDNSKLNNLVRNCCSFSSSLEVFTDNVTRLYSFKDIAQGVMMPMDNYKDFIENYNNRPVLATTYLYTNSYYTSENELARNEFVGNPKIFKYSNSDYDLGLLDDDGLVVKSDNIVIKSIVANRSIVIDRTKFPFNCNRFLPFLKVKITALPNYGIIYKDLNSNSIFDDGDIKIELNQYLERNDLDDGLIKFLTNSMEHEEFKFRMIVDKSEAYISDEYTASLEKYSKPTISLIGGETEMDENDYSYSFSKFRIVSNHKSKYNVTIDLDVTDTEGVEIIDNNYNPATKKLIVPKGFMEYVIKIKINGDKKETGDKIFKVTILDVENADLDELNKTAKLKLIEDDEDIDILNSSEYEISEKFDKNSKLFDSV